MRGAPDPMVRAPVTHKPRHPSPLTGPSPGLQRMTRYAKANPGSTYEELAEASGWKVAQVERVVVAWEAWGLVYRDRQWDPRGGRWATCVRPVAK